MFKFIILTAVLLPAIFALDKFEKCKYNGGGELPKYVDIKDCEEAPCHITEGDFMEAEAGLIVRKSFFFYFVVWQKKNQIEFYFSTCHLKFDRSIARI